MNKVLFVCMGNICRSPAAEAIFRATADKREVPLEIDSAGTHGFHIGSLADPRMRDAAGKRGYLLESRARQICAEDLERFDLIIAMDHENVENISQLHAAPSAAIRLLGDFLDDDWPDEVPDPYYGGKQGFETVLDMIETACPEIHDFMCEQDA